MILANGNTSLEIPNSEFWWADEFEFEALAQSQELTVNGALVVDQWPIQTGRTITLAPCSDAHGYLSRGDWRTLDGWRATPGLVLTLSGLGANRDVIFGRPAIEAEPIHNTDRADLEWWRGTIRLIEVS